MNERKRLPPFPVSGVKNPAPVAIGFNGTSSGGALFTGNGRGGKSSSISGVGPGCMNQNQKNQIVFFFKE